MDFIRCCEEQRVCRQFNKDAHVDIQPVLDAIRHCPTAYGIQPFVVDDITDQSLKEDIYEAAGHQTQVIHAVLSC